jgi:hypothetical protein
MSLAQRTTTIRLRFRDNDGAESTCECNLAAGVSPTSAISFASAWAVLVQALSDAVLVSSDVILRWHDPSPSPAAVGSNCFAMGTFILDTASSDFGAVRVPAIALSFLETTGPFAFIAIDQTLSTVIALTTALVDGLSGVEPCDPFASDYVSISAAYLEIFE